ncbi:MAG: hypothetical protein KTR32_26805 [Granulosicoccus sp.]|nr:hypothetical protein [Granulosicoccus sp.]
MPDRKKYLAVLFGSATYLTLCHPAAALNLGFDGHLFLESSDNVEGANVGEEQNGVIQSGLLGVYGEQRSQLVDAAFRGELDTRKVVSDEDSDLSTTTRFLGAAEFKLTPRSWRWYIGDILGGIRNDDGIQPIDDNELIRRNVLVTGPSFAYDVEGVSRTRARVLYVHQSQDDVDLDRLYNANFNYERDAARGNYYGFRLSNIYTDVAEVDADDATADTATGESEAGFVNDDYNRTAVSAYYNRRLGFYQLLGELGTTRYEAEDDSLTGFGALLRLSRQLGEQSLFSVALRQSLSDQSLSAIESLIASGDDAVGVAAETDGFFEEIRLGLDYSYQGKLSGFDVGGGVAQLDYQALSSMMSSEEIIDREDRQKGFAYVSWSQQLTSQLLADVGVSYESQDYDNLSDHSDSTLISARFIYDLTNSFSLQLGFTHDTASGVRTDFNTGVGVENDIDITENRVSLGLRWQPPSRASQNLTVELKSLLR